MPIPVVEAQNWKKIYGGGGMTIPLPPGTNSRHFCLLNLCVYAGNSAQKSPTMTGGWTRFVYERGGVEDEGGPDQEGGIYSSVWYKFTADGEPDPVVDWFYSNPPADSNPAAAVTTLAIANVDRITPIQMSRWDDTEAPSSNVPSKPLVTTGGDALAVAFAGIWNNGGQRLDPISDPGWILRYIVESGAGGQDVAACQATKNMPLAGDTGQAIWADNNIGGIGHNIVLNGGPGTRRVFIS